MKHHSSLFAVMGALLAVAGCRGPSSEGGKQPAQSDMASPVPTTFPVTASPPTKPEPSIYAARRLLPDDIKQTGRAFIGPIWFGSAVQQAGGQTFVEARRLALQLDALTPGDGDFLTRWDFGKRTITIEKHVFKSAALVNRTGFVGRDEAAKVFDLAVEQHGDLTMFEPLATIGGRDEAPHVYRNPNEFWDHDDGPKGPRN